MGLRWTDTLDIVIALDEAHPDVDPQYVNFVDFAGLDAGPRGV